MTEPRESEDLALVAKRFSAYGPTRLLVEPWVQSVNRLVDANTAHPDETFYETLNQEFLGLGTRFVEMALSGEANRSTSRQLLAASWETYVWGMVWSNFRAQGCPIFDVSAQNLSRKPASRRPTKTRFALPFPSFYVRLGTAADIGTPGNALDTPEIVDGFFLDSLEGALNLALTSVMVNGESRMISSPILKFEMKDGFFPVDLQAALSDAFKKWDEDLHSTDPAPDEEPELHQAIKVVAQARRNEWTPVFEQVTSLVMQVLPLLPAASRLPEETLSGGTDVEATAFRGPSGRYDDPALRRILFDRGFPPVFHLYEAA